MEKKQIDAIKNRHKKRLAAKFLNQAYLKVSKIVERAFTCPKADDWNEEYECIFEAYSSGSKLFDGRHPLDLDELRRFPDGITESPYERAEWIVFGNYIFARGC